MKNLINFIHLEYTKIKERLIEPQKYENYFKILITILNENIENVNYDQLLPPLQYFPDELGMDTF